MYNKSIIKIIKHPRITEKASFGLENNVYTFDVSESANKNEIRKFILELYKVNPLKINITRIADKRVSLRGKKGLKSGGKKAVVFLKKGDKIDIV